MTYEELKELVQSNSESIRELRQSILQSGERFDGEMKESGESMQEFREEIKAIRDSIQESREEIKEFRASIRESREETKAIRELIKELDEISKKYREELMVNEVLVRSLLKGYGGLSNKFGSYTESFVRPSLQKVLLQEFEAFLLSKITSDKHKKGKRPYEVDAIAISNGSTDAAYVVEIKSRFRPKDLNQILKNLNRFPEVFVEYADLEVYGVVA